MKPSADYVHVRNGKVMTNPAGLPDSWEGHRQMRTFSDKKLAELGWYPVEYKCPSCRRHLEFAVDEERKVVVVQPHPKAFERIRAEKEQLAYQIKLDALVGYGFVSSVTGIERIYYGDPITVGGMNAAVQLQKTLRLFCRSEEKPFGEWVDHAPETVAILLGVYVDNINLLQELSEKMLDDVQAARDLEELESVFFVLPKLPEWAAQGRLGPR